MPSLTTMNVVALIATVFGLLAVSVGPLRSKRRDQRQPVMLGAGLLTGGTGALLGEIARMTGAPHDVLGAVDVCVLLLTLGGGGCVLVSIRRSARVQSGTNGNP
jgi:hypothetical protein